MSPSGMYITYRFNWPAVKQDEECTERVTEQQRKEGVLFQQKRRPVQSADIWPLFMLMERD